MRSSDSAYAAAVPRIEETHVMTASVTVTERAALRIAQIVSNEPEKNMLRVSVEGGGCSGFEYRFDLVSKAEPEDVLIERAGAKVLVDSLSHTYLAGSEIDYVDDLMTASFKIKNPNATAACGCGTSFSV
jgi:iron-sulfur cluster assembly accessory protein